MPAIYKGEDVRVEVKLNRPFNAYNLRQAVIIFPSTAGVFGQISTTLTGSRLDSADAATENLPVVVFNLSNAVTGGASLLPNSTGYLEVRVRENTTNLFDIITVPLGPVIETTIRTVT